MDGLNTLGDYQEETESQEMLALRRSRMEEGAEPEQSGYIAPPEINRKLSRTEELLRLKRKAHARQVLDEIRLYAAKNPRYWWNMARTARTRDDAAEALARVILLRPRHQGAWQALRTISPARAASLTRELARAHSGPDPDKVAEAQESLGWTFRAAVFAMIAAAVITLLLVLVQITGLM